MGREVKEYDERMQEILATARGLFFTKGYDATSINDIISAIGIAKGTFYHYFDSKQDLLLGVADQLTDEGLARVQPDLTDASLAPIEKFNQFFLDSGSWKAENREQMVELMRIISRDENIMLVQKMDEQSIEKVTPLLTQVINEGIEEGVFDTEFPRESAEIILAMGVHLSAAVRSILLEGHLDAASLESARVKTRAYERAVERVLGAPAHSMTLIDTTMYEKFADVIEKDD